MSIQPRAELVKRLSLDPVTVGYSHKVAHLDPDITFIVQNHRIRGHASLLSNISPVFRSMFFGPMYSEGDIVITDTKPEVFQMFMKIIYKGVRSVAVHLSPRITLECLILANKYLVFDVETSLRLKLLRNITYKNALEMLPYCVPSLNLLSVQSKCWSMIERETLKVLQLKQFVLLDWNTFCDILENGRLSAGEYEIFRAAKRWAEHKKRTIEKFREKSLKEILGVAIYKIRFPLMSKEEWKFVCKTGLLKRAEIEDLNENFKKNQTFPNQPRKNQCQCRKERKACLLCSGVSVQGIQGFPTVRKILLCRKVTPPNNGIPPVQPHAPARHGPCEPRIRKRLERDINKNITPPTNDAQLPCECMKYKSCPGFPNGRTADILKKIGYINV